MIPIWKKQLILDRLKAENEGLLDYITPDDVIIKPFGAKCQVAKVVTSNNGDNRMFQSASMINTRYFGGRFKDEINGNDSVISYTGMYFKNYQKYRITGKPERYVIGEFIIAVYINEPTDFIREQNKYWVNNNKPDKGYFVDVYQYANTLFMDTTVLKGREIDQLRKEEIVGLLPSCIVMDMNDVEKVVVDKFRRKDSVSANSARNFHEFDYIQVTIYLKMTDDETSFLLSQNNNDKLSFFIVSKDIYANAKNLYYDGNTSNLRLALSEDDFRMSGCSETKENGNLASVSLVLEHNDCPEYATMLYDYYRDFVPERGNDGNISLEKFKPEIQKIIIDTLARFHHWKWGTQNQPNNYSEIPSSHNLKDARVYVVNKTPTKYTSASSGTVYTSGYSTPSNVFIKDVVPNRNPNEETVQYVSVAVIPDEKYNTGYDGQIVVLIRAKLFRFDEGIR